MNLTNREKILIAIAFEQAITFTKMALDNNSSEIREANPLELAVEWLVWNVQEDNNSALKEMYDTYSNYTIFSGDDDTELPEELPVSELILPESDLIII